MTFARKLASLAAALSLSFAAVNAHAYSIKGNEITLRIGSGHPPFLTYIVQLQKVFIAKVKERVEKETDYTIKFNEHYSGSVVNVFDTLEGIQDGRLDIGGWCPCFDDDKAMGLNAPYFVPFSHPNAVKAREVGKKLLEAHPELYADLEKRYNQKLLTWTGLNNYGLLTAFEWKSFDDLTGHKILAAGPNLPWVQGGIPVRASIPKAAQQLQTGVGEGIVLFPDTAFKLKLHEATGGGQYTLADFGAVLNIVLSINLDTAGKLPPDVLKIIEEVSVEYGDAASAATQKDHDWGVQKLKEAGVTIHQMSDADKTAWAKELAGWPQTRADAVEEKKGIDMGAALNTFIRLNEETGHSFPIDYKIE